MYYLYYTYYNFIYLFKPADWPAPSRGLARGPSSEAWRSWTPGEFTAVRRGGGGKPAMFDLRKRSSLTLNGGREAEEFRRAAVRRRARGGGAAAAEERLASHTGEPPERSPASRFRPHARSWTSTHHNYTNTRIISKERPGGEPLYFPKCIKKK